MARRRRRAEVAPARSDTLAGRRCLPNQPAGNYV